LESKVRLRFSRETRYLDKTIAHYAVSIGKVNTVSCLSIVIDGKAQK